MFIAIRILFVLLVIGFGFAGYKYLRERDTYWLRVMRWLLNFVIAILLIWFVFIAAERLFGA